ncbi:DJ-1/PfpI family protein [Roseobacter sinensis]|uniref:DJ-1/PfpI family protein n=1 Tax=Roseobacter sinensis TaxID=2931391 RepID=A0ABT3BJK3_9RHOB|nr:DJ-1/PfpI family protein [Roseobacter sp. WL0113]MCV3273754.1 DJ-1/PfpI family protein [Roseobacter sp. WL0113]
MKSLAVFVFPGVQTLDLFGPIEFLGGFAERISLTLVAETDEPVVTRHGQRILPDTTIHTGGAYDLLLIPGGDSALDVAKRPEAMAWIRETVRQAEYVMTVCTGSILLGLTGALDGRRATTNKIDFRDTVPLVPRVDWVEKARWVHDGKFFTSSGVSAGMDMALAAIAHVLDQEAADWMADGSEYEWHRDPSWDPFADKCGLGQE